MFVQRFLARQPIFDAQRAVYGYELLYRSGAENRFTGDAFEVAAASTLDGLLLFGIERLVPGCRAFINCTRDFLLHNIATMLPPDRVVVEILATVHIDDGLIAACRRLKYAGYLLALDDFQDNPAWQPLVNLADFIKVDLLATSRDEQLRMPRAFLSRKIELVAEKVETNEEPCIGRKARCWDPETESPFISATVLRASRVKRSKAKLYFSAVFVAPSFASITTRRATSSGSIAVLSTTTASAARTKGEVVRSLSRRSRS
jgi:hypothetical protein